MEIGIWPVACYFLFGRGERGAQAVTARKGEFLRPCDAVPLKERDTQRGKTRPEQVLAQAERSNTS